jgi:hypothetical protein
LSGIIPVWMAHILKSKSAAVRPTQLRTYRWRFMPHC